MKYRKSINIYISGILFCFTLGSVVFLITMYISNFLFDPLLIGLILGVLYKNFRPNHSSFESGSKFISKHILEFSVMLLGATINVSSLLYSHFSLLILVVVGVFGSMLISYFVGHILLKLNIKTSTLIGVGNGICGNSAVAVVGPIIGATSADITSVIGISAVLGASQILFFPILFNFLHISEYQYGILVGMSVYAVAQVYAASATISIVSASIATVVKISRVLLLGPLAMVIQTIKSIEKINDYKQVNSFGLKLSIFHFLPWFVIGFVLLSIFLVIGIITPSTSNFIHHISKYFFIVSIIAIGLSVDMRDILKIGHKVAITILSVILFMVVLSLIFAKNVS